MERLAIWLILAAAYGGVLALLVQILGQGGVVVWVGLVIVAQWWLRQRTRGY